MCGICGFSGKHGYSQSKMETLLLDNEVRGSHATGIYSVAEKIIKKHNVPAKIFTKLFPLPAAETTLLGHTRHATQGGNTPKNAHPFRKGNIVGVHNGIIRNDAELGKKYDFKAVVDSEAIFEMIDRKGIVGLEEIRGVLAIAWVDKTKPDSLFLYRSGNPCFTGLLDGGIYFSSLEHSLREIGCTDVGTIKSDVVFEFKNGKVINSTEVKSLSYGGYYGSYGRDFDDESYGGGYMTGYWGGDGKWHTYAATGSSQGHLNYGKNSGSGSCGADKCNDPNWKWDTQTGTYVLDREKIVSDARKIVAQNATSQAAPSRGRETLSERKAKLDAAYKENGQVTHAGDKFIISYPKSRLTVEIDRANNERISNVPSEVKAPITFAPAASRSMSVVKPEKVMSDTTLDKEGKLAGGYADTEADFLNEIMDVLQDCKTYLTKTTVDWDYERELVKRLDKILL